MTIQTKRMRIAPMWKAGLRHGRVRNETTLLLQRSPVMQERLRRIDEQLERWGVESMPLDRVKRPFEYERR